MSIPSELGHLAMPGLMDGLLSAARNRCRVGSTPGFQMDALFSAEKSYCRVSVSIRGFSTEFG